MKVFLSLSKLYISSFYNLPGRKAPREAISPDGKSSGSTSPRAKPAAREILKVAGIAVLTVLLVVNFGYLFVMINLNLYAGLSMAGMQELLILNAAVMATMLTVVIGFMMALSSYYLNDMELLLLSMPINPRSLLGAKFVAVYFSEAAFSLFFMVTTMIIFGIKEGPGPLFYVQGTLAGLLLPFPALALCYFIQIPLLSFARFLKNKKNIMLVAGVLGLVLGLGVNVYFQKMMPPVGDPSGRAALFAGPDSLVAAFGRSYPPALFAWQAMTATSVSASLLSLLALAASCLLAPVLLVVLLSGVYARSLTGFNESHIKKLDKADADAFIARRLRSGNAFLALVRREFSMMNREPMYLLNGPFIVVLMPVIVGIMFVVQKDALMSEESLAGVAMLLEGGFGAVVAGLAGAFLGSSTSIACTAVSRDAKALPFMKSLPVTPGAYMMAKLGHAMIFGIFGSVVGVGLLTLILKIGAADALAGVAVSLSLSSLLNLAGLWLDTANPRLSWDNPIAAMKQNPNAVIAILASMGVLAGAGYLSYRFALGSGAFALWFGAVPALIFSLLLVPFMKYAHNRIATMEA